MRTRGSVIVDIISGSSLNSFPASNRCREISEVEAAFLGAQTSQNDSILFADSGHVVNKFIFGRHGKADGPAPACRRTRYPRGPTGSDSKRPGTLPRRPAASQSARKTLCLSECKQCNHCNYLEKPHGRRRRRRRELLEPGSRQAGGRADKLLARATHFSSASSSPEFLVKSRCLSVDTCRASGALLAPSERYFHFIPRYNKVANGLPVLHNII